MSELTDACQDLLVATPRFQQQVIEFIKGMMKPDADETTYAAYLNLEKSLNQNISGKAKELLQPEVKKFKERAKVMQEVATDYESKFTKFGEISKDSPQQVIDFFNKIKVAAGKAASEGSLTPAFEKVLEEIVDRWHARKVKIKTDLQNLAKKGKSAREENTGRFKDLLGKIKDSNYAKTVKMVTDWDALDAAKKQKVAVTVRDKVQSMVNSISGAIDASGMERLANEVTGPISESLEKFHSAFLKALVEMSSGNTVSGAVLEGLTEGGAKKK